ncbi:hypothetical protein DACRYDRAFT_19467 [Dacryopinax primogenitus]|uniref:Sucraseferredoxin-like protein n=1 Tax=Dacryopinax primogenitus (strain DJM 731) TaxID=1858805 RepID=M5G7N1_DACPD|nr:uncharacterized protein DACRYDRAFT_19467 [Dacryopinax primogenitus]EJU06196.1 hypothetical protein DACRYDRAFT_19467 [Dacryopinax primogenitus]
MSLFSATGLFKEEKEQDDISTDLDEKCVPFSLDACRFCAEPCDEDHLEYPAKLDVDQTPGMFGSVKPYARQIVISTGKTDWPREITEEEDSLAQHVAQVNAWRTLERQVNAASEAAHGAEKQLVNGLAKLSLDDGTTAVPTPTDAHPPILEPSPVNHDEHPKWDGVWQSQDPSASRLSILNGSHTASEDGMANVLIFPDYKMVRVEEGREGAETLWENALNPDLRLAGKGSEHESKSYLLPYSCVILLCSHKRRDNRCHIVAPKLLQAFTSQLEYEGWQVDHNIDENYDDWGDSLESITGLTQDEREMIVEKRLADPERRENKRVLILRSSHVGGHKYAGNVILAFPTRAMVWYGRVTPHEVASIVKNTITDGKVLPKLMRGGMNLSRKCGKRTLLEW